ncbi:uncharacterized protein L199_004775 [Kwoniella botswanensis]|uniref:uncharacterized protein n=1 Tax=Kwoniella botswanensis TaxID=1268659 RepID=UPI00315CC4F4
MLPCSRPLGGRALSSRREAVHLPYVKPAHLTIIPSTTFRHSSHSTSAAQAVEDTAEVTPETPSKSAVLHQLKRVTELQSRVSRENSNVGKQMIIAQYPDLRELLEYIYDPNLRTNLTFGSLLRYLDSSSRKTTPGGPSLPNVIELFERLSKKQITGNEAKDVVHGFLAANDVLDDHRLLFTFGRLLDRNLAAGFGANTLKQVIWPNGPQTTKPSVSAEGSLSKGKAILTPSSSPSPLSYNTDKTPIHPQSATLDKFEVALGKSLEPPFEPLFKDGSQWYASRKLDGVRCITFLDFLVPSSSNPESASGTQPLKLVSAHFVSRTGKEFTSLIKLEEQLQHLSKLPELKSWLDVDPLIVETRPQGVIKRLVLDGEVCVMRPKTPEESHAAQARDDGSLADTMWIANDNYTEDFQSTVSLMRRSGETIQHLSYFIFDVLSYSELNAKKSLPAQEGLGKKFGKRIENIRNLGKWLNEHLDELGVKEKMVKDLKQIKVGDAKEVEEMVERAAREGWEGIILRKNEEYKGKRSPDIRKFKKWLDSEYTVRSLDTSSMRLSVDGVFGEYEALANVWIEHDGHPVSVGSGFTAEQRIRYAKHPEQIVGKMITVEYFGESESMERDKKGKGQKSLRFPRVKVIWEEGKRGI